MPQADTPNNTRSERGEEADRLENALSQAKAMVGMLFSTAVALPTDNRISFSPNDLAGALGLLDGLLEEAHSAMQGAVFGGRT
jgi:hypothetical protein